MRHGRQTYGKAGPAAFALAVCRDRAAVELDELLGNRQPETEAEGCARRRRVLLTEAFEHVGQETRGNALAVVDDGDLNLAVNAADTHLHAALRRSEFDGVVDQIPQYLLQPARIAEHAAHTRIQYRGEDDALRIGRRL